ncbi:MAG: hypothetical protein L6R28_13125 [Planctomycetes bacterium]|nr:hypothetical protein [Planctomycetota bacterium]
MEQFLEVAFNLPTVIYTVLLIFVLLFWGSVLAAGLDPHMFDAHVEVPAHVDVPSDVHVDAHVDGHVDAHGEVHAEKDVAVHGGGHWVMVLLTTLNIGTVPVTVVLSCAVFAAWTTSMALNLFVAENVAIYLHPIVWIAAALASAGVTGLIVAALATRPLRPLFKNYTQTAQEDLIDQICTIRTSHVDEKFGQAEYETDGAPLILSVCCRRKNNDLTKGVKAVIVGYNRRTDTYEVAKLDPESSRKKSVKRTAKAD